MILVVFTFRLTFVKAVLGSLNYNYLWLQFVCTLTQCKEIRYFKHLVILGNNMTSDVWNLYSRDIYNIPPFTIVRQQYYYIFVMYAFLSFFLLIHRVIDTLFRLLHIPPGQIFTLFLPFLKVQTVAYNDILIGLFVL